MARSTLPSISIITPTLNAGKVLALELQSIRGQDYPQEMIEIIIADGGSIDNTLEVAMQFNATVVSNLLKTGEAGKAVGVKKSQGELIALIDSDNILPDPSWLRTMVQPFLDNPEIMASEPWQYTYRKEGGFIERYSALLGMNDPIVLFYGNYDRLSLLTGRWTDLPMKQKDRGNYLEVLLEKGNPLPTIGANGTIFRADFLKDNEIGDYLFDIDLLAAATAKRGTVTVAKVKVGIIHTFCEADVGKFSRKQKRRAMDYFHHRRQHNREAEWAVGSGNLKSIALFSFYTLTLVGPLFDSFRGYLKKPDFAWFFHPLACLITFFEYAQATVRSVFLPSELSRETWKQ